MLWVLVWLLALIGAIVSGLMTIAGLATVLAEAHDYRTPINKTRATIAISGIFITAFLGWAAWAASMMS